MATAETPAWRVLLIGGNSGSGKTTVASQLGRRFGVAWAQVDDFRLALQRVTTPTDRPALHFFVTERVWDLPAERLCVGLIGTAEVVSEAIRVVIAHHVLTPHPLILEGDGLTPAVAAAHMYADAETRGHVRAVFLCEDDEEVLLGSMLARGRGFRERNEAEQRTQGRASRLYGQWLRAECERHRIPVLPARPRETILGRVLTDLGRGT